MASSTQDDQHGNIHTGLLEVKIELDGQKVVAIDTQHIKQCYFIEDIFATCMMGKVSFVDEYGMYEYGPFTGNETLSIRYGRTENREVVFTIISVEKIMPSKTTGSQVSPIVVLEIADTTFHFFTSFRYSRSFESGSLHTNVIRHIIKNMVGWDNDKNINIMPSTSKLIDPFCMPYWTPKKTIDWLMSHSYSKDDTGYLCYANTMNRHTINVQPITKLLSKTNTTDNTPFSLEVKNQTDDPMQMQRKILEWWVDGLNHTITPPLRNNKYMGYDITTKTMHENIFSYDDGIKFTPVLGNYSLFHSSYTGNGIVLSNINTTSGEKNVSDLKRYGLNIFSRLYSIQQLVNIMTIGNEKRYAGHQIMIDWSSIDQSTGTKNRIFDGAYLVKSITHDFATDGSPLGYIQRIVLIKNGFQNPSTKALRKSIQPNLTGGSKTTRFNTI